MDLTPQYKPFKLHTMNLEITQDKLTYIFKQVSLLDLSDCEFEPGADENKCWINATINGKVIDAIEYDGNLFKMMNNNGGFDYLNPMYDAFVALESCKAKENPYQLTHDDFLEVLGDRDRLVRELDVLINGEEGAAKQAALCDIVSQLKNDYRFVKPSKDVVKMADNYLKNIPMTEGNAVLVSTMITNAFLAGYKAKETGAGEADLKIRVSCMLCGYGCDTLEEYQKHCEQSHPVPSSLPAGEGVDVEADNIKVDVQGSNIGEVGWLPSREDCGHMPEDAYEEAKKEYHDKNAKVIFSNTHLHWESCDCGSEYGCSHPDWVYEIDVLNGNIRHKITIEDDNLYIENASTKKDAVIPIDCSINDFYRTCKMLGIELELTDYGKTLFISGYTAKSLGAERGGYTLSTDELFKHMQTVEYEAWGHQAVMLWCMEGKWNAGLRNNKFNDSNRFEGTTAYEALYKLYEYCLKNGFVDPLKSLPATTGEEWISVIDKPLFIKTEFGWECTKAGDGEFWAAAPYTDNKKPNEKNLWWIRHCIVEDGIGLCVVGDDDNEKAGWELEDVQYYIPIKLPLPPHQPIDKQVTN